MILIRADANEQIGTGHVMRCISIAQAFVEQGEKVLFLTADHKGDKLITSRGFSSICLDSEWTKMEDEIPLLIETVRNTNPKLLLIDSYYVTETFFRILRKEVHIAYVDDMNASCWEVDYIINYNIFAQIFDYSGYKNMGTKLFLGPCYTPLREEFMKMKPYRIKNTVTDIMISSGGADPESITEKLIRDICPKWEKINFHFVVGALNPRISQIRQLEKDNTILHINEHKMSNLMQKCDIAIAAAGTTLYELCAVGIPTITFSLADNQLVAAKIFDTNEIMINVGDCRDYDSFIYHMNICLRNLVNNQDMRKRMSNKMRMLVDGNGAKRIVGELLCVDLLT